MKYMASIAVLAASLLLSACDPASMPAPAPAPEPAPAPSAPVEEKVGNREFDIQAVRVTVPRNLRVSEADVYYPIADIVWRGEPRGDRHAQVQAIFDEAMARGTRGLDSGPDAVVDITVQRFHALTEKTRYTFGGVHSLKYELTVRDARTGEVLDGPRRVNADVKASGGLRALAEEQAGRTQRVVIVEDLARSIRTELTKPWDAEE